MSGSKLNDFAVTMNHMNTGASKPIYSGNLTIIPNHGRVEADGKIARLGPVNMKVLILLVNNHGQVLSRNTIFKNVWKNQEVSDDVLTRCISDLRNQLGKISPQQKLIETFPKLGYKWLPTINSQSKQAEIQDNDKISLLKSTIIIILGLLLLSTAFLWTAKQVMVPDKIKIALLPLSASPEMQGLAKDIEGFLQDNILKSNQLGYLSTSILKNINTENFSYLSNEYGTQWLIEGNIRNSSGMDIITLNLVDTRTALVVHSINSKIDLNYINMKIICSDFIKNVTQYLNL